MENWSKIILTFNQPIIPPSRIAPKHPAIPAAANSWPIIRTNEPLEKCHEETPCLPHRYIDSLVWRVSACRCLGPRHNDPGQNLLQRRQILAAKGRQRSE